MKTVRFYSPIFVFVILLIGCAKHNPKTAIQSSNSLPGQAQIFLNKARFFLKSENLDSTYAYFIKAYNIYKIEKDSLNITYTCLMLADIHKRIDDYNEVEAFSVEAKRFLNNQSDTLYNPSIYNDLGMSYRQNSNYKSAIASYREGLRSTKDSINILKIQNNIANVYIDMENFNLARSILLKANHSSRLNDVPIEKARILDNLGYASFHLGNKEGLSMMKEALSLRSNNTDIPGLINSFRHLAETQGKSDKLKGIKYASTAEKLARNNGAINDQLFALQLLAEFSPLRQSVKYYEKYTRIKDSILQIRQRTTNEFANIKYDYKTEKEKSLKLDLALAQEKNRSLSWLLIAVVLFAISFFIIILIIRKNKRHRWKASYDAETRIARRLHDELSNEVHQAIQFTETQDLSNVNNREKLLRTFGDIYNRTRNISRENNDIDTGAGFVERLRELIAGYLTPQRNIVVKGISSIDWDSMEDHKKVAVHRIVQELLVNMKKHSAATQILLAFSISDKQVHLNYSDNGSGGKAEEINPANGLVIMENRIRAIRGKFTFESVPGKGFRVHIHFPM
jgi:signal transduction histidine kinase